MNDPKKLTRDQLSLMKHREVFFQYSIARGGIAKIIPSVKIDNRLRIIFKELGPVDVATLLLEHNLDNFDKRGMKVAKPVILYKGVVKSSKVKKRIGLPWYSVNVVIAPGIVVKHFLTDSEMKYVQHEKNTKLDAEFMIQEVEEAA